MVDPTSGDLTTTDEKAAIELALQTAKSDLAALSRVSHRLALVDTSAKLQAVLDKLLPRLLKRIGDNHQQQLSAEIETTSQKRYTPQLNDALQQIHTKLVEMFSHTLKRVRDDSNCQLPCLGILHLLTSTTINTFPVSKLADCDALTINLALPFLAMGINRLATETDLLDLLPLLLVLMADSRTRQLRGTSDAQQHHQLVHLLLTLLERIVLMQQPPHATSPPYHPRRKPENSTATTRRSSSNEEDDDNDDKNGDDPLEIARQLCSNNNSVAAAVFDLLLDVFLYQPTPGNVPPPGLSPAGRDRLCVSSNNSNQQQQQHHRDLISRAPRVALKLALLEWVAPQRRWGLLGAADFKKTNSNNNETTNATKNVTTNRARTLALLIVATADTASEVSDRAGSFLKQHVDTLAASSSAHSSSTNTDGSSSRSLLSDPVSLAMELLILCLGETHADAILQQQSLLQDQQHRLSGAVEYQIVIDASDGINYRQQKLLSTKRRPVTSECAAIFLSFVASKILDDHPNLFNDNNTATAVAAATALSTLAVELADRTLSSAPSLLGLSKPRARPYSAALDLLLALVIRWSSSSLVGYDDDEEESATQPTSSRIMARCLSIVCGILSSMVACAPPPSAGSSSNSSTADGSIAIRDTCYGIVASLSRCAKMNPGLLFARGQQQQLDSKTSNLRSLKSIETATLLFECAAREEERLRPRAVAALDALLAAYCRVYTSAAAPLATHPSGSIGETLTADQEGINSGLTDASDGKLMDTAFNPWLAVGGDETSEVNVAKVATSSNSQASMTMDPLGLARSLLPLLWSAAQSYKPKASRVAAARWASDLLKALDLPSACHILCFLAGDSDVTAASIARDGLGLPRHYFTSDNDILAIKSSDYAKHQLPDFSDFTEMVFPEASASTGSSRLHRFWDFSFKGKAATLRFGLYCLLNDLYGGEDRAVQLYLSAVTKTLGLFIEDASSLSGSGDRISNSGSSAHARASVDLLDECSACLLTTLSSSRFARSQLAAYKEDCDAVHFQISDIEVLALKANSSRARRYLAGACGKLWEDSDLWKGNDELLTFDDWATRSKLAAILTSCSQRLSKLINNNDSSSALGRIHGSAFLGAHVVRALRLKAAESSSTDSQVGTACESWWTEVGQLLEGLGRGCLHDEEIVGNACSDSLAIAMSYENVDAPVLDEHLYQCTASVLTNLTSGLNQFCNGDSVNPSRASKVANAAGSCLAATTTGSGIMDSDNGTKSSLGLARLACADALFEALGSMAYRKEEEISIVVGEALAEYADAYSPKNVQWSFPQSRDWPAEFVESFASQLPPHEHVLYILLRKVFAASSPHKKTACAPALLAVAARGAYRVNSSLADRSLVHSLKAHLEEVQSAFIFLLSYPKSSQFSRESCCLGLAACRGLLKGDHESVAEHASDELNHRLLRAFGQTTNFGRSAMMETNAQAAARREREGRGDRAGDANAAEAAESEVGGASGMGEAALGAYREMASASVSLGRHDILYALLLLSVSHSFWLTAEARYRYSASSLLGESAFVGENNSFEFRNALRPHLGKLLPRILRACYDPNRQTREQMTALWNGLTGGSAEGRSAISRHLLPTIDILIEDASSKLWRARVGACGALGQIIVGREWSDLGGGGPILSDDDLYGSTNITAGIRLLRIWKVAMRALDDVRGAVRDSGESLARAARGLTIRLCDPSIDLKSSGEKRGREVLEKHERDATAAAATSLRWLIRHGLNQSCDEATGVCVSTLVEVVGVVRPKILEPALPDLIRSLLLAMSGLEPAALNYLQLRTSDHEGLERIRLQLASSGPLASALTKCLELLPSVGLKTQQRVAPELDSALRQSAGFATRAATADAVSTLCSTCPAVFRFSGSSNANPSVRLLRAFYFASERERGAGAKDKMIHALGNLAALCPPSSVRTLAVRACERYRSSTGNNFDPASRRAAAAALRTIAVRASGHYADGGKADVWCRRVLPCAYLGRKDSDAKIASLWSEVWEEGGSAASLANISPSLNNFGTRLEEKLLPALVAECVSALHDVSWSRRVAGSSALVDLCDLGILSPIARSTGSTNTGDTNTIERARCRAESTNTALQECLQLAIKPRLWKGKADVLNAIVKLASKWVASAAEENADLKLLYGWNKSGQQCPWRPITVSPSEFRDDLFVGDQWFLFREEVEVEENAGTPMDFVDEGAGAEEKLEFDDVDNVTSEEDEAVGEPAIVADRTYRVATFTGLCRFLCQQAMLSSDKESHITLSDDLLPYKSTAFRCFRDLVNSLPTWSTKQRIEIFRSVAPLFLQVLNEDRSAMDIDKRPKPVLVAGAIDCIRSCLWDGVGAIDEGVENADAGQLIAVLNEVGGKKQPAWTVREAAALCCAQVALLCHHDCLRRHGIISQLVEIADYALADRKFYRARIAGLKIIDSLTIRAGTGHDTSSREKLLLLESLLPQKEILVKLLRTALTDSESKVTALSTTIISRMTWWP